MDDLSVFQFLLSPKAVEDFRACRGEDVYAAGHIRAFLEDIRSGSRNAEDLMLTEYEDEVVYNVSPLIELQNKRINVNRVRLITVNNWRLIFGICRPSRRICLFAIMHRDADYNKFLLEEIETEYDALGFHRY